MRGIGERKGMFIRSLVWGLWVVPCIVIMYFVMAVILGLIPVNADHRQPAEGILIYVSTNGTHADLVVPTRTPAMDWFTLFPPEQFQAVDTLFQYAAFGWGDRGFYLNTPTWNDLTPSVAIHALFWPSAAAMHVDLHSRIIPDAHHVPIRVTAEQYQELIAHILSGFRLDDEGLPLLIAGENYYEDDNFYEANGHYHVLRTSNTWTAEGLRKSGVRTALWSPFDRAIMYHARRVR